MNLLHVIRSLDARGGGPQEGLKQIVLEMDRAGWGSEVASLDAPDVLASLPFPAKISGLGPARGGYGYAPGAVRWLGANAARFDAVWSTGSGSTTAWPPGEPCTGSTYPISSFRTACSTRGSAGPIP